MSAVSNGVGVGAGAGTGTGTGTGTAAVPSSGGLVNKPSLIEYKQFRFLITDAPSNFNLPAYITCLQRKRTVAVVRACEPTYDPKPLTTAGIAVLELPFNDGEAAPEHVLRDWFQLLRQTFGDDDTTPGTGTATGTGTGTGTGAVAAGGDRKERGDKKTTNSTALSTPAATATDESDDPSISSSSSSKHSHGSSRPTVAVHCVAGLGRAPVLVCVALIECGMSPLNAIDYVRKKRRGAINTKQLKYLSTYKTCGALKGGKGKGKKESDGCKIM